MKIAVTGVGLVTALGIGVEENISAISQGLCGIKQKPHILCTSNELPIGELQLTNTELHQIANIPISEHLSRTALLGILAVKDAIKDANVDLSQRVGLVSSTSVGGMDLTESFFKEFMVDENKGRLRDVRMHDCAASTNAIAKYCGITGYRTTISTACSSAANAILFGAKLIKHNILDTVIVGGCDSLSAFTLNGFKSLMILDSEVCKPFDENRNGLNLGEGAGFIVLSKTDKASYCYLSGYSNKNDAHHQTASSEQGDGAFLAMSEAMKIADLKASDISYINVHGTGTKNNDSSEGMAMMRIFGNQLPLFSSTKAFTGHTLAAAGGIEAVLSCLAIKNGYIYPNLNFKTPIKDLGITPNTKFIQCNEVKNVISNSFGFGGNCSSLIFTKA